MPDSSHSPDKQGARAFFRVPRLLRRLRGPILLMLAALGFALLGERLELEENYTSALVLAAKICTAGAIGWAITNTVDAAIARQLSMLRQRWSNDLDMRRRTTRLDVLRRVWNVIGGVATMAAVFTVIPWARQIGVSMFASAGIAGIALGIAARPMLANLIAGLQIAFTQPIRIEDAVVVENEWGWIEEIGLFYVVIRVWDWRRLVVPLSHFIEKPFQNWTRESGTIIGSIIWEVDHRAPIAAMREELHAICRRSPLWDSRIANLQVTDTNERTISIRALASAPNAQDAWDLRCFIREEMIVWLQTRHPEALPRLRAETVPNAAPQRAGQPAHEAQSA